jgi:hypothetical protein
MKRKKEEDAKKRRRMQSSCALPPCSLSRPRKRKKETWVEKSTQQKGEKRKPWERKIEEET